MKPYEVTIDLANIGPRDLHLLLQKQFEFPDYYGANWDAFEEALNETDIKFLPQELVFKNYERFAIHHPWDAQQLKEIFDDLVKDRPNLDLHVQFL